MATQTGRTIDKWTYVVIGDAGNTLRELPVKGISAVGLKYDESDVTAWGDAVKNYLANHPEAPIELTMVFDTSAAQAAPESGAAHALSGSHTVLAAMAGDNLPHTLDIRFGIRHAWETGEPQFGLQRASASNSGYTVTEYTVSGSECKAKLQPMGSIAPAWGTSALTSGS